MIGVMFTVAADVVVCAMLICYYIDFARGSVHEVLNREEE